MKNKKNEMAAEFKKRYADVSVKAKAVKDKLKEVLNSAKDLSKDAKALCDLVCYANDRLYYVDDDGVLYPTSKQLGNKMDKLELWADCDLGITNALDYL